MFPIIYKMAQRGTSRIAILCQNLDYNIHNDFILDFLKKEHNIKTKYSYHIDESVLRRFLSKFLLSMRSIYPKIGVRIFNRLHRLLYGKKWAENLLDHFHPSALIMDFDKITKYSTKLLSEAAKKKQIPFVLVTHGVTMRLSGLKRVTDLPTADYKIFPNRLKVKFYTNDNDSDQVVRVLGSPRYCDEWEKIYNGILAEAVPHHGLPEEKGKLKVLFFERPVIGFDENHEAVRAVRNLDFVTAAFKVRVEKKGPYHKVSGNDYPSARLVQWADVVVMSISSIALEVLWQEKPLIYVRYLAPDDVCVFDQYRACWAVNSEAELIEALKTIHENPGYRAYDREDVERLFNDVVYAGDRSRDIMGSYVDFLLGLKEVKK